ncbi:norbelladine synthase-like [Salvia miltiorrhiza]|uniref:norbelladine synthase-like n=1 Tax=Salvia miltiorrhiza TaxID=226208 RepID=UPI0025AD4F55|nr:norbelladine synthase-like [Salvia miltiorrhiza]
MHGIISDEKAMKVPASEAWKLIGTLQLAKFVEESLPNFCSKIDVLEGDGAVGTILRLSFPPGTGESGLEWLKEKFTVVDNEKLVKVTEVVEGGYLDVGFTLYRFKLEVMEAAEEKEKEKEKHCIVRYTIEYEVKQDAAANASLASIQPLTAIMQLAADYLLRNYNNTN